MEDKITEEKLEKYFSLTSEALEIVKGRVISGKESEAKEIIDMVSNYLSDAGHFKDKGDFVNAFGALNYAHGWLDCGVRLGIFDVDDDRLFTVR
tara:strand:- start:555 stop:836 length:282 start_codon:yes stop_codon:yes gene_type:complete